MEIRTRATARRFSWLAIASLLVGPLIAAEPGNSYLVTNLVSDGSVPAAHNDSLLINAWGIASNATGPWWVNSNGKDISALYDQNGIPSPALQFVNVSGAPTGIVSYAGAGFQITNSGVTAPARFLFDGEEGTISAWSPAVQPTPPIETFVVVPNDFAPAHDAVYKGLAIAQTQSGDFLYAADFHNNRVDVFDSAFHLLNNSGAFVDPKLPKGYAPFGIQNIQNRIVVSYAKQDEDAHDEIDGDGFGFVDAYDTAGTFLARIASRDALNAPWGLAMAPANFGRFSNMLLVGNFGDGRINVFDPMTFEAKGHLKDTKGKAVVIDRLWGIGFGNNGQAGPLNVLYFAAGPDDESGGLFGRIDASQ